MKKVCVYKCKQCDAILDSDGFLILPENILDGVLESKEKGTHEAVAADLTETLKEMQDEGITEEIVTKYGLDADGILLGGESK